MIPWQSHKGMARLGKIWRITLHMSDSFFLEVMNVNLDKNTNLMIGKYALVHFVSKDVFSDVPTKPLYGKTHPNFHIDDNCNLI